MMGRRSRRIVRGLLRARTLAVAAAVLSLCTLGGSGITPFGNDGRGAQAAPPMAFTFGKENSWIRVQNIATVPANVTVRYYNEAGGVVATDNYPSLGPGQGWTFFQEGNPGLPIGYKG